MNHPKSSMLSVLLSLLLLGACCSPVPAESGPKYREVPETDTDLPGAGPIRRYEWFRNLWRTKRQEFAQRADQDRGAVVFFGDSITQGWGLEFHNEFPRLKAANRGISGDTTRGMLLRLADDVLALEPAAVVLLMGTNDLEEGAEPEVIAGNLRAIVAGIKQAQPQTPIILCQVFPSSAEKRRPAEKIKQINKLYVEAVQGDPQVIVLDTWLLFANEAGDARLAEFPDLLHPNRIGYAQWAAALRPIFATLGLLEREPDDFVVEEGFVSLFNGRDLTGWGFRDRDLQPLESFDGQVRSADGRYLALNGRLIVTTPPEGRRIQQLWTTQEFPGDFLLKLEFRATPNADSGVFIRKPQLQCRDYRLAGPYKQLEHYKPQDWNELTITVKGNVAECRCNGELLEAEFKLPETGPIGLEGDRGQMEYRRIRIRALTE